ncbi:MAG: glycosyltransferase [Desulfosalsimonadaceae bacterium]
MWTYILNLLTVIHFLAIAGLALYGIHRIWLIRCWLTQTQPDADERPKFLSVEDVPVVTVQIPLFNEPLVAGRIIDAVAAFDWPMEKLEIQVLDDSSDETRGIVAERAAWWSAKGLDIVAISRTHRTGFKAGALAEGLHRAKGEYIGVFDADFVPRPDFLKQTLPYFDRPDIGMVQARWGFLNAGYSWLTRLQALLLSTHFGIEHAVRCSRGLFFNFNGTAGVWRKAAILSSGGWQSDTVTEDLDLSYRAQLAGWRFVYAHNVVVPSELPVTLSDFRTQQERWGKGAIQTARKLLPKIFAANVPVAVKMEAAAHLLANCCWMLGFIATLTLYPVLLNRIGIGVYQIVWMDLPLFLLTGIAVLAYYILYGWRTRQKHPLFVLSLLPAVSIGLAPFFSMAVIKGMIQKGGMFTRTPKFGILDNMPVRQFYSRVNRHVLTNLMINIPLLVYTLAPVCFAWGRETWPAIPFLCLFPAGFVIVITHDFCELIAGETGAGL